MQDHDHEYQIEKARVGLSRRKMLKTGAWGLAVLATLNAPWVPSSAHASPEGQDHVILQYTRMLERLQGALYDTAVAAPYTNIEPAELALLAEMSEHCQVHDQLLADMVPAPGPMDYSTIDFTSRSSVLLAARNLSDLSIAALGAVVGQLASADHVQMIAAMMATYARHSAVIRSLLKPRSVAFAGPYVVGEQGLAEIRSPAETLSAIRPYVQSGLSASDFAPGDTAGDTSQTLTPIEALNELLVLTRQQDHLTRFGLEKRMVPAGYRRVFRHIGYHEALHTSLLRAILAEKAISLGSGSAPGLRRMLGRLSGSQEFATFASDTKDVVTSASLGLLAPMMVNRGVLTLVARIAIVESRHAAVLRQISGREPWDGPMAHALNPYEARAELALLASRG